MQFNSFRHFRHGHALSRLNVCLCAVRLIYVFFRRVTKPRPLWEYLGRYKLSAENDLTTTEDPSKMDDKQFDTLLGQMLPPACTSWLPRTHEWAAGKGKRWNGKGEEIAWLTGHAHEMVRERDFWACNCVEFVGYDEELYEFLVGQSQ